MFAKTITVSVRCGSWPIRLGLPEDRAGIIGPCFDHDTAGRFLTTALEGFDQRVQGAQAIQGQPMRHRYGPAVRRRQRNTDPFTGSVIAHEHQATSSPLGEQHRQPTPGQRVERMRHHHVGQRIRTERGPMHAASRTARSGCSWPTPVPRDGRRPGVVPACWIADRERCQAAGVPAAVEFATKIEQMQVMLTRAFDAGVPFAWFTADEAYGQVKAQDREVKPLSLVTSVCH
jgi:DDE superfamily endonuclease